MAKEKTIKAFVLTKEQAKHLKTLKWLLDTDANIGTGRSHLMAITFIEIALEYCGRRIIVFDHFPTRQAAERLLAHIRDIISQDKRLLERATFFQDGFSINY